MPKPPALLMLSGGIDSTFVAWQALREGRRLTIHHIRLVNREGRAEAEDRAVQRILRWFRQKRLTNFTYSSSVIDHSNLRYITRDYASYAYMAGVLLSDPQNRNIGTILHPRHKDGFNLRKGETFESASKRANDVITGVASVIANRPISLELPIVTKLKAEVIAEMPKDLLALTWHCRRPRRAGSQFTRCRSCYTCRLVDKSGVSLPAPRTVTGRRAVQGPKPKPVYVAPTVTR